MNDKPYKQYCQVFILYLFNDSTIFRVHCGCQCANPQNLAHSGGSSPCDGRRVCGAETRTFDATTVSGPGRKGPLWPVHDGVRTAVAGLRLPQAEGQLPWVLRHMGSGCVPHRKEWRRDGPTGTVCRDDRNAQDLASRREPGEPRRVLFRNDNPVQCGTNDRLAGLRAKPRAADGVLPLPDRLALRHERGWRSWQGSDARGEADVAAARPCRNPIIARGVSQWGSLPRSRRIFS